VSNIPHVQARIEPTWKRRYPEKRRSIQEHRTVVDRCPRCDQEHAFVGAIRDALAYPACGPLWITAK
jgi:hypothetical protein